MRPATLPRFFAVVVWATLGVVASACASDAPEVPLGPDGQPDPVLVEGREIYVARCANCHGGDGGGGRGPKLKDGAVVEAYPSPGDQAAVIVEGRDQMPAFQGQLTSAQVDAVVRYTREVLG